MQGLSSRGNTLIKPFYQKHSILSCIFDCQYFRLKVKNPDHAIAPGLEVSGLVEYYTTKAEDAQDRVILVVDNDVVEIPLVALVYVLQKLSLN